ncbi:MAG: hypothetical protein WCG25_02730 [bacterium]
MTDSFFIFVIISKSGNVSRENFIWKSSPSSLRSIKTKSQWSRIDKIRQVRASVCQINVSSNCFSI